MPHSSMTYADKTKAVLLKIGVVSSGVGDGWDRYADCARAESLISRHTHIQSPHLR